MRCLVAPPPAPSLVAADGWGDGAAGWDCSIKRSERERRHFAGAAAGRRSGDSLMFSRAIGLSKTSSVCVFVCIGGGPPLMNWPGRPTLFHLEHKIKMIASPLAPGETASPEGSAQDQDIQEVGNKGPTKKRAGVIEDCPLPPGQMRRILEVLAPSCKPTRSGRLERRTLSCPFTTTGSARPDERRLRAWAPRSRPQHTHASV